MPVYFLKQNKITLHDCK